MPLLFVAACSKEQAVEHLREGASVTVSLPEVGSKTALGNKSGTKYPTLWSEGDCLQLNGYSSLPLEAAEAGGASASFVFRDGLSRPFNVLYPVSGEKDLVVFPAAQNHVTGSFDSKAAPMWGTSDTYSDIRLQHLSSLVRISITSQEPRILKSITLTALGDEAISGTFRIGTDADGAFDGSLRPENGTSSVRYSFGSEGLALGAGQTAVAYIAVPCGNYSAGFKAVVQSSSYEYRVLKFFSAGRSIAPGKVLEFPAKSFEDMQAAWEYYVSESGNGNGLSEDSPMSIAGMLGMLQDSENERLNGATFHFIAGEHTITEPLVLPGKEAYTHAVAYTITGDNKAVLNGNGTSQIMISKADNSHVTVRDLVLTNGSSTASGGLVSIQNAGPLFLNCDFTNTGNSSNTGAAVRISEADMGSGRFANCTFSGNKGTNGGAIVITNANTTVQFTECSFEDNVASADGGVIYATNGTTKLERCVLEGNSAVNGGAISATGGTIFINGGRIADNTASVNAGAIYAADKQSPVFYINACAFVDNKSLANAYAIYLNTSSAGKFATLCVNNSTFYNKQELTGSNASIVCNKGKSIILNSTIYGKTTRWGAFALGCHKNHADHYGCLLLNSIFVNTASSAPAIYQTGSNYWAVAKNCISSASVANDQFTQSEVLNTVPTLRWNGNLFTWNGETALPQLGKADIEAELSDERYQLGSTFLGWLNGIGALDTDQQGNPRRGYIWAGSYQN